MNKKLPLTLFFFCFLMTYTQAKVIEIPLKNATMAEPHYKDAGHNDNPMALINDPFAYEPLEPLASFPEQRYLRDAQAQPKVEDDLTISTYDPSFPIVGRDKNWYASEIEIPEGKCIEYLDVWGRGDANLSSRHRGLVIILENENSRWYSNSWSGVSHHNEDPADYGRFDFTKAGVTDNLLSTATKIIIAKKRRNEFMTIAEIRLAGNDNPHTDDLISPRLETNIQDTLTQGNILHFSSNEEGNIYLVPAATSASISAIHQHKKHQWLCQANGEISYQLEGLSETDYKLFAIDKNNNISAPSSIFTYQQDNSAPTLSSSIDTLEITGWIPFHCDENATIYLVPKNTENKLSSIQEASLKQLKVEKGSAYLSTYNLPLGNYWLYAIDEYQNVSAPSSDIILIAQSQRAYKEIPIHSASAGNFFYYLAKYGMGRFTIDDPFAYNPNYPMRIRPDQTYAENTNDVSNWTSDINDYENAWLEVQFKIPEGEALAVLDIWGRLYLADTGTLANDDMATAHQNLVITLSDSTHTWQSQIWSGVSTAKENGAYGRFNFSTANVEPQSLLKTATTLKLQHNKGNANKVVISELRLAHTAKAVADAGPDQQVELNAMVELDGSMSAPSDVTYLWTQISGPEIYIYDHTSAIPFFDAPDSSCIISIALSVNDAEGLSSEATDTVNIMVGQVNQLKAQNQWRLEVYPNPSTMGFHIHFGQQLPQTIKVFNTMGQMVYQAEHSEHQLFLAPEIFKTSGVYFLTIGDQAHTLTQKLIVK